MTPQQLAVATGARIDRATEHLPHIEAAMQEFGITTKARRRSGTSLADCTGLSRYGGQRLHSAGMSFGRTSETTNRVTATDSGAVG